MKMVGLAFHAYYDVNRKLPARGFNSDPARPVTMPPQKANLSWRVAILPYLDEDNLYRQFRWNEPWDSPHNRQFLSLRPAVYAPVGRQPTGNVEGGTYLQVFSGPDTLYPQWVCRFRLTNMPDGTSTTILFAEAGEPVPWTKPDDVQYDAKLPLPKLGALSPDGFFAGLADGAVRFIDRRRMSEKTLRLAIDPADGGVLPGDW
jgi:hypothetical protein